jgi:hypothetical protein
VQMSLERHVYSINRYGKRHTPPPLLKKTLSRG